MKVVFPGTFNPFHYGHLDIVNRASSIFDEVVVLFCVNPNKPKTNNNITRLNMELAKIFVEDNVKVVYWEGTVVDYCVENNVNAIIKGVRNQNDLVYEQEHPINGMTRWEQLFEIYSRGDR